ncbi:MAG: TauD/TfdA family dioxygenase [Rhodospirillaceae bacterium]|nr:TauD/TfdA family dioxygenase [Rhodospirillaceae bacterium]
MNTLASQDTELSITPRFCGFSATIEGLNLSASLSSQSIQQIQNYWLDYPVLVITKQNISDVDQVKFAKNFGNLEIHPSVAHRSTKTPEIYRVSNVDENNQIMEAKSTAWQYLELTWLWHTDSSFREIPSLGSILHGIEIPPTGGDTLFADMTKAFDALPKPEQERISTLNVFHSHDYIVSQSKALSSRENKGQYESLPRVKHPLVRRHPVTKKQSLFLSPHTMESIVELKEQEGRVLLDDLIHHATQHQFVYRHKWKVDDVLMWDNRCTMHAVLPYDSINHRRVMHRTTVIGDSVPKA